MHLLYSPIDGPPQILAQGAAWLSADAGKWTRAGLGHPEGFFEAFANLYTELADALLAKAEGRPLRNLSWDFPTLRTGSRAWPSSRRPCAPYAAGGAWTAVEVN